MSKYKLKCATLALPAKFTGQASGIFLVSILMSTTETIMTPANYTLPVMPLHGLQDDVNAVRYLIIVLD